MMTTLNKVLLIGNLTKEFVLGHTHAGIAVANMVIATDASYLDGNGTLIERCEWNPVVVYGHLAVECRTSLRQGSRVYVEGHLESRRWQDSSGRERHAVSIKADRVLFLDSRDRESRQKSSARGSAQDSRSGTAFLLEA